MFISYHSSIHKVAKVVGLMVSRLFSVLEKEKFKLCSGVHVCWSEHSDSSFVYGFMILNYGFGTMTATTLKRNQGNFDAQMLITNDMKKRSVLVDRKSSISKKTY